MFGMAPRRRGLFGSSGMGGNASLVATPEQEAESERLAGMFGMGAPAQPAIGDVSEASPIPNRGGGLFGQGGIGRGIAGAIGDALLQQGGAQPIYAPQMMLRQRAQDDEAQYQRRRADENTDWQSRQQWSLEHKAPGNPYRFEDNAGNVYERGDDGQNNLIFTDPNDKTFMNGNQLVTVPNVVRQGQSATGGGAAEGSTATNPTTGEKVQFRGGQWVPVGGAAPAGARPFASGADPMRAPGRMTSGRRTVEGNRIVGGKTNSRHLSGDAADYVGTNPAALRAYYGAGVKVIPESDHLHVQGIGAGRVPYFGKRGTKGLRK